MIEQQAITQGASGCSHFVLWLLTGYSRAQGVKLQRVICKNSGLLAALRLRKGFEI